MPRRRALLCRHSLLASCLLLFVLHASAGLVNVTIDDSDPLIIYSPAAQWSTGETCASCTAHPDVSRTFSGTWHDSTFPSEGAEEDLRTASLVFNGMQTYLSSAFRITNLAVLGSAIYVYCILPHSFDLPDSNADMTFIIDGQVVGTFMLHPSGASDYDYDVPVYVNSSIPAGVHSFALQSGHVGGARSLVLLDYIVFS